MFWEWLSVIVGVIVLGLCAIMEADNDWIEEQALELWSAVPFAVELGLQDLVLEYEIKGLVDDYGHISFTHGFTCTNRPA